MPKSLKLAPTSTTANRRSALPEEKLPFLPDAAAPNHRPQVSLGAGRRILVADDNPVVLMAFQLRLKSDGFAVRTTTSADEVVGLAEESEAELIVLDINFPPGTGMDWTGYKILHWLRRFPALAQIPVIFISGEESAWHREQALAEGAFAFFEKPVSYPELVATILRALESPKRTE